MKILNLLVYEVGPEPSLGSLVSITRHEGSFVFPNFINVLNNNHGLTDGLVVMDKDRNLFVNWVHLEKKRAFMGQVLLNAFIVDSFFSKGYSDSHAEHTRPTIQQNNFFTCHCDLSWGDLCARLLRFIGVLMKIWL